METLLSLSGGNTTYQCVLLLTYISITLSSKNIGFHVQNKRSVLKTGFPVLRRGEWDFDIIRKQQDCVDHSLSCWWLMKEAAHCVANHHNGSVKAQGGSLQGNLEQTICSPSAGLHSRRNSQKGNISWAATRSNAEGTSLMPVFAVDTLHQGCSCLLYPVVLKRPQVYINATYSIMVWFSVNIWGFFWGWQDSAL